MTDATRGTGAGAGLTPYLLVTVSMFFFASNVIIGRAVHLDIPPLGLSNWRWIAASILFLPLGLGPVRRQWQLIVANWKRLLLMSVAMVVFGNTLVYVGLQYTTALNGGIMPVSRPVVILSLTWLMLGTAITRGQVAGVAIAMLGVLTIVLRGDLSALAELRFNSGDLLLFAANVGISVYQVLLSMAPRELHPNALLQVIMTMGAVMLLPFYALETVFIRPVEFTAVSVSSILAVAIFPSIIAISLINRGIVALGPGRVGIMNYLSPVFIAIMAIWLLGETPHLYHGVAISLVIVGILVANRDGGRFRSDG